MEKYFEYEIEESKKLELEQLKLAHEVNALKEISIEEDFYNDEEEKEEKLFYITKNYLQIEPIFNNETGEWYGCLYLKPQYYGNTFLRLWKFRYSEKYQSFILERFDDNFNLKGEIKVCDIIKSPPIQFLQPTALSANSKIWWFEIKTNQRNYIIGAQTESSREKWCGIITMACNKQKKDDELLLKKACFVMDESIRLIKLLEYINRLTKGKKPFYQQFGSWIYCGMMVIGFPITNILLPVVKGALQPIKKIISEYIQQAPQDQESFQNFCRISSFNLMNQYYGLPFLYPSEKKPTENYIGQIIAVCLNEPLINPGEPIPFINLFSLFVFYPKKNIVVVHSLCELMDDSIQQWMDCMINQFNDISYPCSSDHAKKLTLIEIKEWQLKTSKKSSKYPSFQWSINEEEIINYSFIIEKDFKTRNQRIKTKQTLEIYNSELEKIKNERK